jgi:RNA polymerase sigma-70 factor (ECF subfamily)
VPVRIDQPEEELIERAQRGDIPAYEEIVRRYETLAVRTAYVAAASEADAEDAAQEAFLKAYAALRSFRRGAPFRPWLLRIVANEARNRRRSARRRTALTLRAMAATDPSEAAPSPEIAALVRERRESLLAAVARLREEDQAVIALRYFLDLDEAEMAAALDIARGTVKSRLSRALARLRETLGEGRGGADA